MIPVMNVKRQYLEHKEEFDLAVTDVLHSGNYIMGEDVETFEKEFAGYCGVKYAIGVSNGTDALVLALLASGIGEGDEVITSAMSFIATAEAIAMTGATPVFVDCTEDTFLLDVGQVEKAITKRTKAVLPVHLYGNSVDMDALMRITRKYGILIIEDCAQAAGLTYMGGKSGSFGLCGCFSFFPTKNIGAAGDGGMIITNDENIYRICKCLRVHGSGLDGYFAYARANGVDDADFPDFGNCLPKYYNYILGRNARLDTVQAALLRKKLPYLDIWNGRRREIAARYNEEIQNRRCRKIIHTENCQAVYYVYVLLVDAREVFREYLKEKGIATGVYFPIPMHLQVVFEKLGYEKGSMPNSEYLGKYGVAIPMFPELTDDEVDYIIHAINGY